MALSTHSGGAADKAGLVHEALWGVRGLLYVLDGEAESIRVETPGDDGAEFYLLRGGIREHWQAKRQITKQETWSFNSLSAVLRFFFAKFRLGERGVFASVSDAPVLRTLTQNAAASQSLDEFREHFLDKTRQKHFAELRNLIGAGSDEETFAFLRSIKVHGGIEDTLEPEFGYRLSVMFQVPWQTTMGVLRDLYVHSSHETLTALDIERYLREREIHRRRIGTSNALDRIGDLTGAYISGQRGKLISGIPIPRILASDVVKRIQESTTSLDILITSAAGGGKSACLCQIAERLQELGTPVLAFRLDRIKPVASPILLGEEIGLGDSPLLVLAEAAKLQPVVLIIDQLDFVSTTSGRHPDFFDTVAALKNEALGLRAQQRVHLVLAYRKFDFEHDHRLKQLTTKEQPPLQLGEFTDQEVKDVLQSAGGDFTKLSAKQQEMLRLPQNLSFFVDARLAQTENRFSTPKELCDAYWTEKRKAVAAQRIDFDRHWLPAIKLLASTMSDRQELSVSVSVMDDFPPEFLEKMASEGVLTADGKRYGFGHETFFDYCFARTLPNFGRDFLGNLASDPQHLFRRAQLRQVLAFLRDDDFDAYLASLESLLHSNQIRPHLKLLAVELVAAHPQARNDELTVLMPWIESEIRCRCEDKPNPDKLGSRIWDRFFSSSTLFDVADRMGLIGDWLQSGKKWLLDAMALYLRWQTDQHAERIAKMLEPFVGQKEWRERLRYMMEGHHLDKSRRFLDLFLRLLTDGTLDNARDRFASNGTFWLMMHGVSERRPEWCAEIAARWLDRQVTRAGDESADSENVRRLFSDGFGVDDLLKSARGSPLVFLENVQPAVLRAARAFAINMVGETFPRDRLWLLRIHDSYLDLLEAFLSACETALELVGEHSPDALRPFIDQLQGVHLYTANELLMHAYLSNPAFFAEEAITALAAEPRRLNCGYSDSPYWISRQIIEKCSPLCSREAFEKLETAVFAFLSPFELTEKGSQWIGNTAYNLASSMDRSRFSTIAQTQYAHWNTQFNKPSGPPTGIRSFFVGSPIEETVAKQMTDDEWLQAISKYDSEERERDFEHPELGGALELARMLQKFTEEHPERFANLAAVGFPDSSHPLYFAHALRGLEKASIPFDLKLTVARRVFGLDQHDCYQSALSVLAKIDSADLPSDAIDYIKAAASNADPQIESWDGDRPCYGGDILTAGINSVRGYAAEAIRDLIFTDAKYLLDFTTTIEQLVSDSSLAVRSCVASTLQAVRYHDDPLALRWTTALLNGDERLLRTPYVQDLIHGGVRFHLETFAPIIERMLCSTYGNVRTAGGTLACLARLYHPEADFLATLALDGGEPSRLGACEVAKSNLLNDDCRSWCESALVNLFSDTSQEVRKKAAGCFWHLWHSPETPLSDFDPLIRRFLASPAFVDEPTYLLHALEDTKYRVPEAALDVCEIFILRCGEEARDMRTSLAADERMIGKLVFTSYAQLRLPALQSRALGIIDQMSLEGLNSVGTHLAEFER